MKSESVGLHFPSDGRRYIVKGRTLEDGGGVRGQMPSWLHRRLRSCRNSSRGLIEEESIDLMSGIIACCCVDPDLPPGVDLCCWRLAAAP